jgi:hypothetical protein
VAKILPYLLAALLIVAVGLVCGFLIASAVNRPVIRELTAVADEYRIRSDSLERGIGVAIGQLEASIRRAESITDRALRVAYLTREAIAVLETLDDSRRRVGAPVGRADSGEVKE